MTETTVPSELTHGKIQGRFLLSRMDGDDEDRLPDYVPVTGLVVTITPKRLILHVTEDPATVVQTPNVCELDSKGWLVDKQGVRGLWVHTGVYTVSFQGAGPLTGLKSYDITVTAEHTADSPLYLSRAAPLTPAPAEKFVVNEQVYTETLAARNVTLEARASALDARDDAIVASSEAQDARDWVEQSLSSVVFTVNGQGPDDHGNVVVAGGSEGTVSSVNGVSPDGQGEVTLTHSDVGALSVDTALFSGDYRDLDHRPDLTDLDYLAADWRPSLGDVSGLADVLEGKADTSAIPTSPEDIGAQPAGDYLTEDDLPDPVESPTWDTLDGKPEVIAYGNSAGQARGRINAASSDHTHDDRYVRPEDLPDPPDLSGYATTEDLDTALETKSDEGHNHDGRYVRPSDLPEPPDLSGYVTDDDERLSDARAPLPHDHDGVYQPVGDYASAAQGSLADSAVQPDEIEGFLTEDDLPAPPDLSGYATTAALSSGLATKADNSALPTEPSDIGAQPAGDYASAAQGALADSAVQPEAIADFITAEDLPDEGIPETITLGAGEVLTDITIVGDETPASTWPDRVQWRYAPDSGPTRLVHWINEYGELRLMPGRVNTVPFRIFGGTNADDVHTGPLLEVAGNRQDRNTVFSVDQQGNTEVAGSLTADNLGVAGIAVNPQGTPPNGWLVIRTE